MMTHRILPNYNWAFVAISLSCLNIACSVETDTKKTDATQTQDGLGLELEQLRLTEAEDTNTQTDIFETTFIAKASQHSFRMGLPTNVWSFNETIPGPLIRLTKGTQLKIKVENQLDIAFGLHISGLGPMTPIGDCVDASLLVTPQNTCTFGITLNDAGLFYYFASPESEILMERGLAGAIHVIDSQSQNLPEDEFYMVFDDILLDTGTQISPFDIENPLDIWEHDLNGRLGNVLLVNGNLNPRITWDLKRPMLLHLLNISNARTLRIASTGNTLYQTGGARGDLNGVRTWEEIPLIYVTPEIADSGIIQEGVVIGHGDVGARPSVLSDPDEERGMIISAGQRTSFVWTPQPTEDDKAYLEWHDSLNGTYHAFLNDGGVTYKVGYGDGWRAPRYLLTTRFTTSNAAQSWTPSEHYKDPTEQNNIETIRVQIHDKLTDGGLPEAFQVTIEEAPTTLANGTYKLLVTNFTRTTQILQFTGATLDTLRITQEDGAEHIIPAGNIGATDTVSIIQRKDNNTLTTAEFLLHIHDVETLEFQSAIVSRDMKTEF